MVANEPDHHVNRIGSQARQTERAVMSHNRPDLMIIGHLGGLNWLACRHSQYSPHEYAGSEGRIRDDRLRDGIDSS